MTNLKYPASKFNSLAQAQSFASKAYKPQYVVLGDDAKYWVVCFADAVRLEKAGYELAK